MPSATSWDVFVTMWIVYEPVAGEPTDTPDDSPVSTTR